VNPFGSAGKDDDTPFDGSGLKIKTIKTRRQLNEAEFESILRVTEKYLLEQTKPQTRSVYFRLATGLASGDVGIDLELGGRN
jgi:hypothetical protein